MATANNDMGIRGVIDSPSNICLSIARIFPDSGMGQKDSVVLDAVSWCADQKARLINLSLGSRASGTPAAERFYKRLEEDGILVVSSSGNDYSDAYNYPASFDSVVSVGAVDENGQRARFSNYNDQVNIVAPGVAIRSTAPVLAISDGSGQTYSMRLMEHSVMVRETMSAAIHDAEQGVIDLDYDNALGKICIAERGTISFLDKALLCEKYGGIAMVIYNNETGFMTGTLAERDLVSIPVVSVSQTDGEALRRQNAAVISPLIAGYMTRSGTSMAAPFVSGVAGKLWAARPACTHKQIREALYQSASTTGLQAGPEGFAESFGAGLVQADSAYLELMKNPPPCGGPVNVQPESNSSGEGLSPWNALQTPAADSSSSTSSWAALPWRWLPPDTPTPSKGPAVGVRLSPNKSTHNLLASGPAAIARNISALIPT
jgi:serine protease